MAIQTGIATTRPRGYLERPPVLRPARDTAAPPLLSRTELRPVGHGLARWVAPAAGIGGPTLRRAW